MVNLKCFAVKDNASAQLGASLSSSALSLSLQSGDGSKFPTTISGSATSSGTSSILNSTGIGASGVVAGDAIHNITDNSWAVIKTVSTDSIITTPLQGGTGNTWDSADTWAINSFVITMVQYNTVNSPSTGVNKREKILIDTRSGDTLTVNSNGRGYDGDTAQSFNAQDNCYLFVKQVDFNGLVEGIKDLLDRTDDLETEVLRKDGSTPLENNTNFTARNNADSANVDLFKLTTGDIAEFQTLFRNIASRVIANDYDIIDKKYFDDHLQEEAQTSFITYTLGENITITSVPVAMQISDGRYGTAGRVYYSDPSNFQNDRAKFDGFLKASGTAGNPVDIYNGVVDGFTGLSQGKYYWQQDSSIGGIALTPGRIPICVGKAISTTEIDTRLQPNKDYFDNLLPYATYCQVDLDVENFDVSRGGTFTSIRAFCSAGDSFLHHIGAAGFIDMSYRFKVSTVAADSDCYFGTVESGTPAEPSGHTYTEPHCMFLIDGGVLYASQANGTTQTCSAAITGITLTNFNKYRIYSDPVNAVSFFFVNDNLVATLTTNWASNGFVYFYMGSHSNTTLYVHNDIKFYGPSL